MEHLFKNQKNNEYIKRIYKLSYANYHSKKKERERVRLIYKINSLNKIQIFCRSQPKEM